MTPLRLAAVRQQMFDDDREPGTDEGTEYFSELMASYGVPADDLAVQRPHTTFDRMVGCLLPRLGRLGERFDLAILAHATPDSRPIWVMSHLVNLVPDAGLAFAVSDQGVAAPFTGLRMAVRGGLTHGARRALVWVADQAVLMHDGPVADRLRPRHDAAVVLVLDVDGTAGGFEVYQETGVAPREVPDRLAAHLGDARTDLGRTTICGRGLEKTWKPATPAAGTVYWAPLGLPCTGVWMVVAEHLSRWRLTGQRVILTDYDEQLRYLSVGVLDVPAATGTEER